MKRFNTITGIVDTCLITLTVITGGISIAAFAFGVGLFVGIALSGTSLLLSLAIAITRKFFKIFTLKQKKNKKNMIPLSCLPKPSQTAYPISFQCKTKIFLLLNFTKYCKRWKNIASSRLILGTRLR